ncbi:MAG TPA: hypothetical protein DHV14_13790 [Micrococcales bacterium]|nr:hypothetical protein [Micrococcales bacterium]
MVNRRVVNRSLPYPGHVLRWLLAPRWSAETGEWDTEGDALRRELTSHANDGVISSAAILQGLLSAGATGHEAVIGVLALMTVGVLTSAGTAFGEASAERRSQLAIVADEQRRLAQAPEEELEELVEHYRAKGLSEELSRAVAEELHAKDALAAQLDAEFDLDAPATAWWPLRMAAYAGLAFLAGSLLPLLLSLVLPTGWIGEVTVPVVALSLVVSGWIGSRSEHGRAWVAILRTVVIGVVVLGISTLAGSLVTF